MIQALQKWYLAHCNGDWEHDFGIVIETLDNPGWSVRIDLAGTVMEDVPYPSVETSDGDTVWLVCELRDGQWQGHCGPLQLEQVLSEFFTWVGEHSGPGVT